MKHNCPLCLEGSAEIFEESYFQCKSCEYIFLDRALLPTHKEEREIYDYHENNPDDQGYLDFLSQIIEPLKSELINFNKPDKILNGLDFGCGPGPAFPKLLNSEKTNVQNYDPIYFPNDELLNRTWDFIISTEVFEHLHHPNNTVKSLIPSLNPNGVLAIMTLIYTEEIDFKSWFYKKDPTHVGFFTKSSFDWIANHFGLNCKIHNNRCITFSKN